MKAILVIDIPDYVDFNICKTANVALSFNVKEYTEPFIKSNVPLKPMLQEMDYASDWDDIDISFRQGWNECLSEITGETE